MRAAYFFSYCQMNWQQHARGDLFRFRWAVRSEWFVQTSDFRMYRIGFRGCRLPGVKHEAQPALASRWRTYSVVLVKQRRPSLGMEHFALRVKCLFMIDDMVEARTEAREEDVLPQPEGRYLQWPPRPAASSYTAFTSNATKLYMSSWFRQARVVIGRCC